MLISVIFRFFRFTSPPRRPPPPDAAAMLHWFFARAACRPRRLHRLRLMGCRMSWLRLSILLRGFSAEVCRFASLRMACLRCMFPCLSPEDFPRFRLFCARFSSPACSSMKFFRIFSVAAAPVASDIRSAAFGDHFVPYYSSARLPISLARARRLWAGCR